MKKHLLGLSASLLLLGSSTFAQRWQYVRNEEFTKTPWTINPINKDTAFISGYPGVIMRTQNGGNSWKITNLPIDHYVNTSFFLNDKIGWADMDGGYVFKTVDGGDTWAQLPQLDSINDAGWTIGTAFFDANNGVVLAWNSDKRRLFTYASANGGATWQKRSSIPSSNAPYDVFWINSSIGYVAANAAGVLKTSDGGLTWNTLSLPSAGRYSTKVIRKVSFVDQDYGWAAGPRNQLLRTKNGGITWDTLASGFSNAAFNVPANAINGLYFRNRAEGWIVNQIGKVHYSADSGKTWTPQSSIEKNYVSYFKFAPDGVTGYYVGSGPNTVVKTNDGGATWIDMLQGSTEELNDIAFSNATNGYAVGNKGTLLFTTDAGTSFSAPTSGTARNLNAVAFASPTFGVIVGDTGTVLATLNGTTWISVPTGTTENISDIALKSATEAWLVGKKGSIWKFNGTGFTAQTSGTTNPLNAVYFTDMQHGWIVGDTGLVLRTINGGTTWNKAATGILRDLNDVYFVNNNVGYIVGDHDYVLKSTDGGITWKQQSLASAYAANLKAVHFTSPHRGWVTGDYGALQSTTDGGFTWNKESGVTQTINAVYFKDHNNAIGVGGTGTAFKFTDNADPSSDATPVPNTESYAPAKDTLHNFASTIALKDSLYPTTTNSWGYFAGVGSDYNNEFAEKYYVSGNVQVAEVISYHSGKVAHPKHVAEINVFDVAANGFPGRKIGRKDVYFKDIKLDKTAMKTVFNEPVAVKDSFFVSFNLTDFAHGGFEGDTLGVLHTANGARLPSDLSVVARNVYQIHSHDDREWRDFAGDWNFKGHLAIFPVVNFPLSTSLEERFVANKQMKLFAPCPNPASGQTLLSYELAQSAPVTLSIYDTKGTQLQRMERGFQSSGKGSSQLDISHLEPGLYVVILSTGQENLATRLVVE